MNYNRLAHTSLHYFGLLLIAGLMWATPSLTSQPARAAVPWYVIPGSDDINACTSPGTACAGINSALSRIGFGDNTVADVAKITALGPTVNFTITSDTSTEVLSSTVWIPAVLAWVHPSWPSLPEAQWIWKTYEVPPDEAINGSPIMTFRRIFTLPQTAGRISGNIQITADNAYELSLNGTVIGHDGVLDPSGTAATWQTIETYPFNPRPGENELVIRAINYRCDCNSQPNPAGVLFRADITVSPHVVYLPLVTRPRPGILGHARLNGAPAVGVPLELRFFDGAYWSTRATTSTGSDGGYSFAGVPSLSAGQRYYVRYRNTDGTPGRLWVWGTRVLTSYTDGDSVGIGDFDIGDIALVAPSNGATVALPYTFQWTPRPATPWDSYEFDLYDPTDGDPYAYTSLLGYIGGVTVTSLPGGFSPGVSYVWEVWVYSPDGGYGISYETRVVTFSNSGLSGLSESEGVSTLTVGNKLWRSGAAWHGIQDETDSGPRPARVKPR